MPFVRRQQRPKAKWSVQLGLLLLVGHRVTPHPRNTHYPCDGIGFPGHILPCWGRFRREIKGKALARSCDVVAGVRQKPHLGEGSQVKACTQSPSGIQQRHISPRLGSLPKTNQEVRIALKREVTAFFGDTQALSRSEDKLRR